MRWREDFIRTSWSVTWPQLGARVARATDAPLLTMLAHYAGAIWNGSEIGRSLGDGAYHRSAIPRTAFFDSRRPRAQPWHENLGKRQVKAPKVYVRDTGLLHALLGVPASTRSKATRTRRVVGVLRDRSAAAPCRRPRAYTGARRPGRAGSASFFSAASASGSR